MLTPSDLTEIERKARACQAEEAANPDAKTCQRPTPELVLRLAEKVRENKRHWDSAIRLAMKRGREISALESERDELSSRVRLYEETVVVANGKLIAERDELRAKADQLREHNAGMGVELLGKDDTIKELRAKVAELERQLTNAKDALRHIADRKESPSVTQLYLGSVAYTAIKKLDAEAAPPSPAQKEKSHEQSKKRIRISV